MSKAKTNRIKKRIVDAVMTILLLFLMAYQVTGEMAHEWIGMEMTVLVIIHQILNRKWYGALLKGKYNPYRTVSTILNILLLLSLALTAFCGMSMSGYAVPFLYGMAPVSFVRRMHLSMSHWTFVLMGLHLGMHIPVMVSGIWLTQKVRMVASILLGLSGGYGLYLFLRNGMPDYLFFKVPFAFLDYEKAAALVLLENLLMLVFWAFAGAQVANLCRIASQKDREGKDKQRNNPLLPVVFLLAAVLIGLGCYTLHGQTESGNSGVSNWSILTEGTKETGSESGSDSDRESGSEPDQTGDQTVSERESMVSDIDPSSVEDGYVLIRAGSFLMGSPESENWRIDDEVQHLVTVSSFYIDPYETTQADYERLMGGNPSEFQGERLPVESITWLDAILYANARSEAEGLTPVYTVSETGILWDRSANGYRLPTEAEWEYACRAGTETPFNYGHTLSAENANFYGHYPYEIEENYFDNSPLEAKPGVYRGTTVEVGSFYRNAWGLYDMHGNVNEWCWDYYGAYDLSDAANPVGAENGTRHVYRGGGWNDFGKNLRSAYRAAGQSDLISFNLGVRLVRNADAGETGTVLAHETAKTAKASGRVLIAFFSWGGNTRGIAQEIQRQTGADIFEISPVDDYSVDYNTVLMEAQEDQHRQARPKLDDHVSNMDEYDVILLGYPNWWASIPMPVASFLEEYDFSGKRIIPFCSHGGGRFGQSLTAIAKLAPDSDLGEGLSVHYSGGSALPGDVTAWLDSNEIERK